MVDIVDKKTRSRMMSGIRGKDTSPELLVRRFLHDAGFRYRLHVPHLPGKPDIVLPKYRAVVEVRGCFWHQHAGCRYAYVPKSRPEFWLPKLRSNVLRDRRQSATLKQSGWRLFEVWECSLDPLLLKRLVREIKRDPRKRSQKIATPLRSLKRRT
jgi:DNA mismatch endonuclease (patch repair protein)